MNPPRVEGKPHGGVSDRKTGRAANCSSSFRESSASRGSAAKACQPSGEPNVWDAMVSRLDSEESGPFFKKIVALLARKKHICGLVQQSNKHCLTLKARTRAPCNTPALLRVHLRDPARTTKIPRKRYCGLSAPLQKPFRFLISIPGAQPPKRNGVRGQGWTHHFSPTLSPDDMAPL